MDLTVFSELESEVRSYIRSFPVIFDRARGSLVWDEDGNEYIDFFCGAGALNYGHNDPIIKEQVIDYLAGDHIQHSLDMATGAKKRFLESFRDIILTPRNLAYRLHFTGPTGANAVEAALKLARQVTGRRSVIAFTHGFHGVSLGALAATANDKFRAAAGVSLGDVTFHPYDGYFDQTTDTVAQLRTLLDDPGSGLDFPAAVIVETVQGEGGVNVARAEWLRALAALCAEKGILLIVDEIQIGIGRSGDFFSFEEAGIVPDIVTLSKSLSGYGFPMSLVLLKPELDIWQPGVHSGTFRGNNVAFVGAAVALETYWRDPEFSRAVHRRAGIVAERLDGIVAKHPEHLARRGRGLLQGLVSAPGSGIATAVSRESFANGLIVETSGPFSEVLKLMPAIVDDEQDTLTKGLDIIDAAVDATIANLA
ncbi:diaminobutyrate--2-oxoglutarate transaminase [Humibacter sp. RRB41]|uniref:diaminobutyrate--2-oxoglutarate transaminase n=1 Tax=Humibacter sp. RRB41 TaxID=2919946 RepID=UPI001FAB0B8C|nr:diaminobutyrate--2-oxoglutarate transaminase [Humibacter sp. RRB41]